MIDFQISSNSETICIAIPNILNTFILQRFGGIQPNVFPSVVGMNRFWHMYRSRVAMGMGVLVAPHIVVLGVFWGVVVFEIVLPVPIVSIRPFHLCKWIYAYEYTYTDEYTFINIFCRDEFTLTNKSNPIIQTKLSNSKLWTTRKILKIWGLSCFKYTFWTYFCS